MTATTPVIDIDARHFSDHFVLLRFTRFGVIVRLLVVLFAFEVLLSFDAIVGIK